MTRQSDQISPSLDGVPLSLNWHDVYQRQHLFLNGPRSKQHRELTAMDIIEKGIFFLSPLAIRNLWHQQNDMKYIAEAEKRRKIGSPAESFQSFKERTCACDAFPVFFITYSLFVLALYVIDKGWVDWLEPFPRIVNGEGQRAFKMLRNQKWYKLLTNTMLPSRLEEVLFLILGVFLNVFFLEARHGSAKTAFLSISATIATGLIATAMDLDCKGIGSFPLVSVLHGISVADLWLNWGVVTRNLFLGNSRDTPCIDLFLLKFIRLFPMILLEFCVPFLWWLVAVDTCPSWSTMYCNKMIGWVFGFCLTLPFLPDMASLVFFGQPTSNGRDWVAYCRMRRVGCTFFFSAAISSILVALLTLWSGQAAWIAIAGSHWPGLRVKYLHWPVFYDPWAAIGAIIGVINLVLWAAALYVQMSLHWS